MAKIVFSKRSKIIREVRLNGFEFNGFQDTSTILNLFQNFIILDKKYRNRLISNRLDRIRLWFIRVFIGTEYLYDKMTPDLNVYPKSGSFVFVTRYFKRKVEYKIYN